MDSNLYTARTFEEAVKIETEKTNFIPQGSSPNSEDTKKTNFKQNKRKWSF